MSAPAARPASAPVRVPAGTTAGAAVREAGLPTTGPQAVVVVRDDAGTLRDLAWAPDADADVEPVAADTDAGRSVIRHSAAHVLAQAVQQLHPDAKLGIGPPITDGFYYDFDVAQPFTPDDLAKLESAMKKIIKSGQRFSRRRYDSLDEARKELADEPYKLELIDLKGGTAADDRRRGDGGRRLRRAHHLRQPARAHRRGRCGATCAAARTCPPPATSRRSSSCAPPPRTGGGARRTRSCSASTARRGRARRRWRRTCTGSPRPSGATTAGSAPSWTCSPSRTRSARVSRSSTPRAG